MLKRLLNVEIKKLNKQYKMVINNTEQFMNEIEMFDPVSIFATYIFMYRNGYLSYQKNFKYSFKTKDIPYLLGIDVIRGQAVCRSLASMLNNLYQEKGLNSQTVCVYTTDKPIQKMVHLNKTDLTIEPASEQISKITSIITFITRTPNHMINLVDYENKRYVLDPTNDGVMYQDKYGNFRLLNNANYKMHNCQFVTSIQTFLDANQTIDKLHFNKETISFYKYQKKYLQALKFCYQNKDLFEYFYNQNEELYQEIYKMSEKDYSLVKKPKNF